MKAVVFIANGSEEIETFTPVDYLRRAGVDVTLAAVGTDSKTVVCSHNVSVNADCVLKDILQEPLPDAVIVPGGMPGAVNISECKYAIEFLSKMKKAEKLLCAICAAPALVLGKHGFIEKSLWTCYPGMQENVPECLSSFTDKAFVHDKNLITGRGPGAAEEFSMEIVATLCGKGTADKIKKGSVQR